MKPEWDGAGLGGFCHAWRVDPSALTALVAAITSAVGPCPVNGGRPWAPCSARIVEKTPQQQRK